MKKKIPGLFEEFLDEFFYFISAGVEPKDTPLQKFFMLIFVTSLIGIVGLIGIVIIKFAPYMLVPLGFLFLFLMLGIAFFSENNKE